MKFPWETRSQSTEPVNTVTTVVAENDDADIEASEELRKRTEEEKKALEAEAERKRQETIGVTHNYLQDLIADLDPQAEQLPEFELAERLQKIAYLTQIIQMVEQGDLQAGRVEVANTMMTVTSFLNTFSANRDTLQMKLEDLPDEKVLRLVSLINKGKGVIEAIDPEINTRNQGKEWGELIPDFMLSKLTEGKVSGEFFRQIKQVLRPDRFLSYKDKALSQRDQFIEDMRMIADFLNRLEQHLVLGIRAEDLSSEDLQRLYNFYLLARERVHSIDAELGS
jgi:hypothetical protein